MRILVLEDDKNKAKQISECLHNALDNIKIDLKESYRSGLEAIEENIYDLLLLDMSMPNFDQSSFQSSGRHRSFAGRDILIEMDRLDILIKTIVVTGFGVFGEGKDRTDAIKLNLELLDEFPLNYLGMVRYNASLSDWKSELVSLIKKNILG